MLVCSRHDKLSRIALVGANQWYSNPIKKIKDMNAVAAVKRSYVNMPAFILTAALAVRLICLVPQVEN